MLVYHTAKEKAAEWDMSVRHIQYLCRTGRIEGAVKRVGAWFIPDDAPVPGRNTKADVKEFKYVGTKSKIFDSAIELFTLRGFDNVSIKAIADHVGIRQSTIYSHFKTKQELLDTIYDFYCHYYLKERLSAEDMEPRLREDSPVGIISSVRYEFKEDYRQKLSDITMIILQRRNTDGRAGEIAQALIVDEGIRYVEAVFNRAVELGRFAAFDTHAMAVFINSVRMFTLYRRLLDASPDNRMKLMAEEQTLYKYAAGLLTDLSS